MPSLRYLSAYLAGLVLLLGSFSLNQRASAQTPITQAYAGYTLKLSGTTATTNTFSSPPSWRIYGPNSATTVAASSATANGWTFSQSGIVLTVAIPTTAVSGSYTVEYCSSETIKNPGQDNEIDTYYLLAAGFTVVPTPPTLPPAGMPAFSWQGTVMGVNTGNGNKTTSLPIVGWTQRGGMGVSCTLYHNSEGSASGIYGTKWTPSYLSYFTADAGGNETVHWDNGLSYTFTKNTANNSYTPPIGILDMLSLNGMGHPVLTTAGNTVYTFNYLPASGQPGYGSAYLSSVADMDGNTLTIGHNTDTTLSALTDATGRVLTYGYSGGHLASVTDPLSRVFGVSYTGTDLTQLITPPLNGTAYAAAQLGYDGGHNINSFRNTRGYVSTFGYNASSSLAWAKDPFGSQTTFTYNAGSTVITDPNGHATTHTYTYSRLSAVTDALGDTSTSNYDVDNILSSSTDKNGHSWGYSSHFTNGTSMSTSQDPLGNTSTTTYDAKNKVTQSVDAVSNVTANTYTSDAHEDLLTTEITGTGTAPYQATSTIGGYSNGLPTTFTDPLSNVSSVAYDANGNVNSATDANNHTSTAVSNALGWKTSSTDANNHTTTTTYDAWGRATAVTAPDNTQTTMTYDLDGDVLTVTDANNHTVTNVYDADDRLIQTTNGRGDVVSYTYDGPSGYGSTASNGMTQKGLLSSKTDGNGHVTTYTYTARNEPLATFYPDGTSESVTYDANSNTLSRTKADGKVIHYAYDADNRLTDITYPTLHATHFGYDAAGRKTQMTDATGTTTWAYGDGIHLTSTVTPFNGYTMTLNAGYDGDGRRTLSTLVGQGSWTSTYDNAGHLHTLVSSVDGTTTFAYDPANRLTQKTKGNAEYETYAYDSCDEVTGIGFYWGDGTYRNGLVYTYDLSGNVLSCNQGFYSTAYGYDGADQLTSESGSGTYPPPNYGYSYDHNGNRLTLSTNGTQTQSFTYDAHDKLTSGTAGNETDGYDANGNQTSVLINGTSSTHTYDDEDRLTSITVPGVGTDTFTYNGLGLRVGKVDSTGTYLYVCDGTSPGSPVLIDGHKLYTPGLSESLSGSSSYYDFDRLGNLWTLDGSSKSQLYYQDTTGFGSLISLSGSGTTSFKFGGGNGCQTDADTGLVLMGHRYYDTRIGRFISQDPAGEGDNWYAYADNNPVNKTDPSGLVIAGGGMGWDPSQSGTTYDPSNDANDAYHDGEAGEYNDYNGKTGAYIGSEWLGATAFDRMNGSSMGPGFMMPARGGVGDSRGQDGLNELIKDAVDKLNKGGISKADRTATEKAIKALKQARKATEKADGDRGSRASKGDMEAPGERAARNAANAERRASFQAEEQALQADAEVATLELDAAEAGVAIVEAAILVGVIVK